MYDIMKVDVIECRVYIIPLLWNKLINSQNWHRGPNIHEGLPILSKKIHQEGMR